MLLDHIEIVGELVELMLTEWSAQIDDESNRYGIEDICM